MKPLDVPVVKKKRKNVFGRLAFLCVLVVVFLWWSLMQPRSYDFTITIESGDNLWTFLQDVSFAQSLSIKAYVKLFGVTTNAIEEGTYVFSWMYTPAGFLGHIAEWVQPVYQSVTLLEWWSIYDVDAFLTKEWLIQKGDYIRYVKDSSIIESYVKQFPFLNDFLTDAPDQYLSLEGFLYPETYFVDMSKPLLSQLVLLQIRAFDDKVWSVYKDTFASMSQRLNQAGYNNVSLSLYEMLILATVVEKEERNQSNRPTIAGVFLNRLESRQRIDADITLCYGLDQGYESCTPAVIVQHLYDASNPYNTRAVHGLPPSPIVTPTAGSMKAVLHFVATKYFFYLHDPQGGIHFAETVSEHNINKSKYLN